MSIEDRKLGKDQGIHYSPENVGSFEHLSHVLAKFIPAGFKNPPVSPTFAVPKLRVHNAYNSTVST